METYAARAPAASVPSPAAARLARAIEKAERDARWHCSRGNRSLAAAAERNADSLRAAPANLHGVEA